MSNEQKQERFLALYQPIHDQFDRFCRARVYGDMDHRDLIHDSLMIAFEKFDSIKNKDSFLSFLIGVSVRLLANSSRKKTEERISNASTSTEQTVQPAFDPDVEALYQALSCLAENQRESIILFELSGFSIKEIAAIQNCGESAVKQRLRRGRARLISLLNVERTMKEGVYK